jgi:hypothetical protein
MRRQIMKAQLKCSNCGAEISNLNFSWGRKQWLWIIPFMLFAFLFPIIMNHTMLKGDEHNFRTDLIIKDTEKRYTNGTIEILGTLENHGKVNWENIVVKAELYGKDGKFLDVLTGHTSANLLPGAIDHFKIESKDFPELRWKAINDMKVKVSDAYHSRY